MRDIYRKVHRSIRIYLESNKTEGEPEAVGQARIVYETCMNISKCLMKKD